MIITGMAHFESVCKKKLVDWYHKNKPGVEIDLSNVFVVVAQLVAIYKTHKSIKKHFDEF